MSEKAYATDKQSAADLTSGLELGLFLLELDSMEEEVLSHGDKDPKLTGILKEINADEKQQP